MLEPLPAAVSQFAQSFGEIAAQLLYFRVCVEMLSALLEEASQPDLLRIQATTVSCRSTPGTSGG